MTALICGSVAFDNIMQFPGQYKDEILPEKLDKLNVAFLVPELRREYGGCAANIAYNLSLLGGDGLPMSTVGKDFGAYADWMDKNHVRRDYVKLVEEAYTAQAYITTDQDGNQITMFHPGAMNHAHEQSVPAKGISLGMIAPDGRDGMLSHAREFVERGIPYIFDPGQGLPMFDGKEHLDFIEGATWAVVNEYEAEMLQEKTGLSLTEMAGKLKALIVTRGGDGATIYAASRQIDIPCATPSTVADPTGCGDAFRGGLLYALEKGHDWETTGRIASLMGTIKVETDGTQNHRITPEAFNARFNKEFGQALA